MWYIIEDEDRIELDFGSMDILDYMDQSIFVEDEDGILQELPIDDDFITEWGWFEDNDDWPKVNAYRKNMGCSIEEAFDNWQEAYVGQYDDDAHFAESLADDLGLIPTNVSWPMNCIDWEDAAKELMYDYFESDGYYFRSL